MQGLARPTILKMAGLDAMGKGALSLMTKTTPPPPLSVSQQLDIELLKKFEAAYKESASPGALQALKKTMESGPDGMVVAIGEARKNPSLLDAINKTPEIQKALVELDAKAHAGGKSELASFLAKQEGVSPDSIYVHDYTGHKGATKLPHDHDATAYRYIPQGSEPPPHTTAGFDSTTFSPRGQLVGDGKHYYDFKEHTVKPIEPGQYYESSVPLSDQQAAYNRGYANAAGTKLKPDYVGKITESNVTSHQHPEAYIEGDYSAKQYKVDNPLNRAIENQAKASTGDSRAGVQALADVDRAIYEQAKTIRKASEHGTLQNLPEPALQRVNLVQNILTSEKSISDKISDLQKVGLTLEDVGQMLKDLHL